MIFKYRACSYTERLAALFTEVALQAGLAIRTAIRFVAVKQIRIIHFFKALVMRIITFVIKTAKISLHRGHLSIA